MAALRSQPDRHLKEEVNMIDIPDCDASDLIAAFRSGSATPIDAYDSAARLIAEREPWINAITYLNPAARLEAERSAERWRKGAPLGPLDGVPITVKDNLCVA